MGDTVENATVKMILREKVILSVNGQDEILEIEHARSLAGGRTPHRTAIKSRRQNITLKRSLIENSVKNVNELMKQVTVQPHFKNGKPDGLILGRVRPRSLFSELGLSTGDIIIGVDGQDIESVDDALKFYQNLQKAPKVEIEIKRRGRIKKMKYNIR